MPDSLLNNGRELAVLVPYFLVLAILSLYGLHRYSLVWCYFHYRRNVPGPPPAVERWPRVTVQLPIYNERYVVERLLEAVARFDYPRELFEVQVLDDSTDETREVASAAVARHRAAGLNISHLHRPHRRGFKAGSLADGLRRAAGEFIAIFDADFLPPPDFLRRTLPYFRDARVGMVQTRWSYLNREASLLTRAQAMLLDGNLVITQGARARLDAFFNFNGTAGIWRRAAIEDAGGWHDDTLTEDTDLSYRAQLRGWRFVYLADFECPSELPVTMSAFKEQQARWAKGLTQTARKLLPEILRSEQPRRVKREAFFHLTVNACHPLLLLLSLLLFPAMALRVHQGWLQVLLTDVPLLLASTFSFSGLYLLAQRELRPRAWLRTLVYLPVVMALGVGLALRNSVAVLEALSDRASEFVRTPKYGAIRAGVSATSSSARHDGAYRPRAGWLPVAEIALGVYFAFLLLAAARGGSFAALPFLWLFCFGYFYSGLASLTDGRILSAVTLVAATSGRPLAEETRRCIRPDRRSRAKTRPAESSALGL